MAKMIRLVDILTINNLKIKETADIPASVLLNQSRDIYFRQNKTA